MTHSPVAVQAELRLCHRVDCPNPVTGRKLYCSKGCSALTRNRRYYNTFAGRSRKHAAASRYFQRHRYEIYAKKAARFEHYVDEILTGDPATLDAAAFNASMTPCGPSMDQATLELLGARNFARAQHDWHPQQQGDSPLGRVYWRPVDPGRFVRSATSHVYAECQRQPQPASSQQTLEAV
jgi:hypothetical protein